MLLSHYTSILLGLVGSAFAIDAYFHLGINCDGPSTLCPNLNPGVCCTATTGNTVGYRGIPTDWVIAARSFGAGGCRTQGDRKVAQNTNFLCLRNQFSAPTTGTRYAFGAGSKRRDDLASSEEEECSVNAPCTSSQKPSQLVLEDGTRFDIVGLEDDVVNELLKLAAEGVGIPESFHSRKL